MAPPLLICPEFEGIKTRRPNSDSDLTSLLISPEFEGIKTTSALMRSAMDSRY